MRARSSAPPTLAPPSTARTSTRSPKRASTRSIPPPARSWRRSRRRATARDSGLAWAEGSLWVGQYRDRKIHQVDPETGAILRTIESNRFVTGVTWVDGELWHGTWEGDESEIRRIDPDSGAVLERLTMPRWHRRQRDGVRRGKPFLLRRWTDRKGSRRAQAQALTTEQGVRDVPPVPGRKRSLRRRRAVGRCRHNLSGCQVVAQATRTHRIKERKMTDHKTGTREEWLAARLELLEAEKELTRRSDELARRRQELPWVRIDKEYADSTAPDEVKRLGSADLYREGARVPAPRLPFHVRDLMTIRRGVQSCSTIADATVQRLPAVHLERIPRRHASSAVSTGAARKAAGVQGQRMAVERFPGRPRPAATTTAKLQRLVHRAAVARGTASNSNYHREPPWTASGIGDALRIAARTLYAENAAMTGTDVATVH